MLSMQRIAIAVVAVGLALLLVTSWRTHAVSADPPAVSYDYLVGVPPLCDLGPSACPAIAMAANGDTVEITGSGSLATHPKAVTGGGTFLHKDSDGNIVGGGTWEAEQLISFNDYGCDPALLPPLSLCGGRALIRVHLVAVGGVAEADAVLQIDCLIGDFPPSAAEGVRLAVSAVKTAAGTTLGGTNFNKEVSGVTVYID